MGVHVNGGNLFTTYMYIKLLLWYSLTILYVNYTPVKLWKRKVNLLILINQMQKINSWYISSQDNNIKKKAVQLGFPKNWLFCIVCVCAQLLSLIWLFVTPWTVTHQAPLSMGFSGQEYWSGLPCPSSGDLPHPGIEPTSLVRPALAGRFFTTGTT